MLRKRRLLRARHPRRYAVHPKSHKPLPAPRQNRPPADIPTPRRFDIPGQRPVIADARGDGGPRAVAIEHDNRRPGPSRRHDLADAALDLGANRGAQGTGGDGADFLYAVHPKSLTASHIRNLVGHSTSSHSIAS